MTEKRNEKLQMWKRSLTSFKKNIGKSPYIPGFIESIEKRISILERK